MIVLADSTGVLPLRDESVQCVVTSPPYWGLRDYGIAAQLGLEATPDEYVSKLVAVFAEVWRVLRDDGTLWLNLGDSYAAGGSGYSSSSSTLQGYTGDHVKQGRMRDSAFSREVPQGLKPKDLIGIPWRVAFALQADGWYLRQDIIWHKPNPMPESVRDRCTKAHEYIFLMSKSQRYWYDADAVAEEACVPVEKFIPAKGQNRDDSAVTFRNDGDRHGGGQLGKPGTRNRRSVWTVNTKPYKGAHFATFPPDLIEPCILAGSRRGDVVLDPFGGTGTVEVVATRHGRKAVCLELNPEYAKQAKDRTGKPLQMVIGYT